jgi:hypothetical protein
MPVKPNKPAIIDTTRKISAHLSNVIALFSSYSAGVTAGDDASSKAAAGELIAARFILQAFLYRSMRPEEPGGMASSSRMPFGEMPVPVTPGDVLGVPGWLREGLGVVNVPVPIPVVVLDCPPGADEMPADPGLAGAAGGALPTPDDAPPCAPVVPVLPPGACAKAADDAVTNDIAMTADRCNLCRMITLRIACGRTNVP